MKISRYQIQILEASVRSGQVLLYAILKKFDALEVWANHDDCG